MRLVETADHIAVEAPAKVNLFLEVVRRRPDGFHEIDTVFQAVSLYDRLSVAASPVLELEVTSAPVGVPRDARNLVWKAARALADRTGVRAGARIRLTKGIPVGAGLGGGSSDAAAALAALNRLWRTDLSDEALIEVAAGLGSDVSFFIRGGTARGRGRGERLDPIDAAGVLWYVILWPGVAISTAEAYRRLDERPSEAPRTPDALIAALAAGDVEGIGGTTFNRLGPVAAAIEPRVGRALDRVRDSGAVAACVTGSGAAVFGLFDGRTSAERAAAQLREAHGDAVWVAHTVPSGP